LARVRPVGQQGSQGVLRPVSLQPDHLATDQVGQHGPKVLPFAPLDLVDAQMARPTLRPRPVPTSRERRAGLAAPSPNSRWNRRVSRACGSTRPTRSVRMPEWRHQSRRNAIPQRDRMIRPGQVVPGADLLVPHPTRPPVAARTDIGSNAPALDLNDETSIGSSLELDHPVLQGRR
jgi:hypothetical protein